MYDLSTLIIWVINVLPGKVIYDLPTFIIRAINVLPGVLVNGFVEFINHYLEQKKSGQGDWCSVSLEPSALFMPELCFTRSLNVLFTCI